MRVMLYIIGGILLLKVSLPLGEQEAFAGNDTSIEKQVERQFEQRSIRQAEENKRRLSSSMVFVIVEFVEVEMTDFNDWLQENPLFTDATPLRKEVQKWVKLDRGKVIKTVVLATRNGKKAVTETAVLRYYPTEYKLTPSVEGKNGKVGYRSPPLPFSFDLRKVGVLLEVKPKEVENVIELSLAPEITIEGAPLVHATTLGETKLEVNTPRFQVSKGWSQISLRNGDYGFLGTSRLGKPKLKDAKNPILLMFVRCDM